MLDWLFGKDESDAGEEYEGEYGAWSDYPENYPADNDFADD